MASTLFALLLTAFTGDSSCVILHFTTTWCQPCKEMQPAIEQLKSSGWDIRSVDTDQQRPIAQQFNVQHLPTLVILNGNREVDRIVGMASHAQIEKRALRAAARNRPAQTVGNVKRQPALPAPNQVAGPAAGSQPIVRGQSPGLSAVTRSVANSLASSTIAAGVSGGRLRGDGLPQPQMVPQLSLDQAIARAARATVRVIVDEGNTIAYGTGTIVDVRGDEALVLTCGHLFRDIQPGSQLTVDLFAGTPQSTNVPAAMIDFSADEVVGDIGLITMKIPVLIEPVEILPRGSELRVDQAAFSFGCDHGANPTRRDTRISRINRYIGAPNVEIVGAPAVGRSGGGLFDEQGRLIGVCNAANADEDEGIYAAAEVVYGQLEKLDLLELFESQPAQLAGNATAAPQPGAGQPNAPSSSAFLAAQQDWPDETLTDATMTGAGANMAAPSGQSQSSAQASKVICIVRDAQGNDRMVTIKAPSRELLQRIHLDSQR